MMCCTEVDGSNSPFGGDSRFAHNLARFHPCGSIGNFARRIQILDDIIVFQQFTRFVGCHDYLPRSGIIGHHIYGAIHYRSQRVLLIGGDEVFGQAPPSTSASAAAAHLPFGSSNVRARSTGCLISSIFRRSKKACAHCSVHAFVPAGKAYSVRSPTTL